METPFRTVPGLIAENATKYPDQLALVQGLSSISYASLDSTMDCIAASLQRDGMEPGDVIAICAYSSPVYCSIFMGAVRAGLVVAPLAPSITPGQLSTMLRDSGAKTLFADAAAKSLLMESNPGLPIISLDDQLPYMRFQRWLAAKGTRPQTVELQANNPFNIIYSSGTTGVPKGIVQSHGMRWAHVLRGADYGYGEKGVTLLATPLYSNTTLVTLLPTLANGGTAHLMSKFDAKGYLEIAEHQQVTHTMLVPVQYQRIMALNNFEEYDLSSFKVKFCTSSPFNAALKADVLQRWPGELVEIYGMTEGGGTCVLHANDNPHKLHTVGKPVAGHDIRLIDDADVEVSTGETGEVVGHSKGMMQGYHGQPEETRLAEWHDPSGKRFIRTGDIGRFDTDGFLVLVDRKKDLIISGGFNIYPTDLENELLKHDSVEDAAVVAAPSDKWGETPVAFVVSTIGKQLSADELLQWFNRRVGSTQRLNALHYIEEIPRNAIGKVLKRNLRARLLRTQSFD